MMPEERFGGWHNQTFCESCVRPRRGTWGPPCPVCASRTEWLAFRWIRRRYLRFFWRRMGWQAQLSSGVTHTYRNLDQWGGWE